MTNTPTSYRLLTTLIIGLIVLLASCQQSSEISHTPGSSLEPQELIGEWEFYWDTLLSPQQLKTTTLSPAKIRVPSSWTEYDYPANGKGTYYYRFNTPSEVKEIAFFIPKIWSNSRVWINGMLQTDVGDLKIRDSRNNFHLEELTTPIQSDGMYEIVVQVANKDIFVAGIVFPFYIGEYQALRNAKTFNEGVQTFWMGCLMVIGLYHLLLFLFNQRDAAYLFISLVSFLLLLKMMVFGENMIYQWLKISGTLDFKWQSSLYYASTYLVGGFGCLYVQVLYKQIAIEKITKTLFGLIAAYVLFVILTPTDFYGPTLLPFQVIMALSLIYIVYVVIRSFWVVKRIAQNTLQIIGIMIMILAAMNDGLYEYGLKTDLPQELLPYAFIIFIFIQMVVLAYEKGEDQKEINQLVTKLEDKVKERTDIIRKQNIELEQKANELLEVDQLKNKYFANISHDFRSPLSLITGYFSMVIEDAKSISDQSRKYLEKAGIGVSRISNLVDQITQLTLINNKGLTLKKAPTDLKDLIERQIDFFGYQIKQKELLVEIQGGLSQLSMIDKNQFVRVIQNLLGNAIEHAPEKGKIEIRLKEFDDNISIKILNTGIPISAEVLPNVFKRFYTNKEGASKGMGLGLELTKELVHLHGGSIGARVEEDMTCFEVILKQCTEEDILRYEEEARKDF